MVPPVGLIPSCLGGSGVRHGCLCSASGQMTQWYRITCGLTACMRPTAVGVAALHVVTQSLQRCIRMYVAGFDVWLANQRGNTYSRRNLNLFPYQPEFWHFSIDTLAQLDLPTQVDYVLQTTGASKIGYVGHSQVWTQHLTWPMSWPATRC